MSQDIFSSIVLMLLHLAVVTENLSNLSFGGEKQQRIPLLFDKK